MHNDDLKQPGIFKNDIDSSSISLKKPKSQRNEDANPSKIMKGLPGNNLLPTSDERKIGVREDRYGLRSGA